MTSFPNSYWNDIIRKYLNTDHNLSQKKFADENGLSYSTFKKKLSQYRKIVQKIEETAKVVQSYSVDSLRNISRLVKGELNKLQSSKPEMLYHYSDVNALIGICSNQSVYATDLRFLNDSKEFTHALDVSKQAICNSIRTTGSFDELMYKAIFEEYVGNIFSSNHRVFVCCFTELRDSLSQWRTYGDNGSGYTIGFDPEDMTTNEAIFFRTGVSAPVLGKVTYDDSLLSMLVTSIFNYLVTESKSYFRKLTSSVSDHQLLLNLLLSQFAGVFGAILLQICPFFKHESYSEEREWRLLYYFDQELVDNFSVKGQSVNLLQVLYRPVLGVPAPYVLLPVSKPQSNSIREIGIGPNLDFSLAETSLVYFVSDTFQNNVSLYNSALSYRA